MTTRLPLLAGFVLILASACAAPVGPTPKPTPAPTPGPTLTTAELKLAMIDAYGALWYCDPDFYPIQRVEEIDAARERWAEVMADADAFKAITAKLGMDPAGAFDDPQKLAVYRAWKVLNAIALDPIGDETYRFDYLAQPKAGVTEGTRTAGAIDARAEIKVEQQAPAGEPVCPICLARGTLIETPTGALPIETLRIGDPVWTLDTAGDRVPGTVIALGSTPAPAGHHVVRVILADGRSVTASPGHPLADGREIGHLRVGDVVDGSTVAAADLITYTSDATFDIVVGGGTGIYFVGGIALGSTLD